MDGLIESQIKPTTQKTKKMATLETNDLISGNSLGNDSSNPNLLNSTINQHLGELDFSFQNVLTIGKSLISGNLETDNQNFSDIINQGKKWLSDSNDRVFSLSNNPITNKSTATDYNQIFKTTAKIDPEEVPTIASAFVVTNNYDSGAGSLRQAILDANATAGADTITFDSSLTGSTITISSQLVVSDNLYIDGLGTGNITIDANGSGRVFSIYDGIANPTIAVTIEGLSIRGATSGGVGGGIFSSENLTVLNSTISNNSCKYGGGIYGYQGSITQVINSTISSNNVSSRGGGIFTSINTSLEVINSTISNNNTTVFGGGIFSFGTIDITNSLISGNVSSRGGGIYADTGTVMNLTESTVSGNIGSNKGGGIYGDNEVTLNINNSTISGNSAPSGGGIYVSYDSTLNLFNSTISSNNAQTGAGIEAEYNSTKVNLLNSTITNNSANFNAGINTGTYTALTIGNTIVYGNVAVFSNNNISAGNIINQGNNLVSGSYGGVFSSLSGDVVGVNPNLGILQNNGGPTLTHALLSGSGAINAGNNNLANNASLTTDQRGTGYVRISNTTVDIGAFEVQALPTIVTNTNDSGVGSLRQAILNANTVSGLDIVTFDISLAGSTITLTDQLFISDDIYINGLGATNLTITANNSDIVFNINDFNNSNFIDVSLEGLTITGGSNVADGGGIFTYENLSIANNVISGNTSSGFGGGVAAGNSATIEITNSTISGNIANVGGGVAGFNNAIIDITYSTVSGNLANFGGGIAGTAAQLAITNSTISSNNANYNGAISVSSTTTVNLINSTITANTANGTGGIYGSANSTISLGNTILYGNIAGSNNNLNATNIINQGNNLVSSGYGVFSSGSGDIIGVNPNLGALQNNGGPTFTHALLSGSAAINTGNNTLANGLNFDQRYAGFSRIYNSTVDIGAFEYQNITNPFLVTNTNDSGAGSLRQAILNANYTSGLNTITFDSSLTGSAINISSQLYITDDVYIDGLGSGNLTINANNTGRVFSLYDGISANLIDVTLEGLTITGGNTGGAGGAIFAGENLTVLNSIVSNNRSDTDGGAIFGANYTTIQVINSTISSNYAGNTGGGKGGAIFGNANSLVEITNSTISGNGARYYGGALGVANNAVIDVTDSTISGNSSFVRGGGIYGDDGSHIQLTSSNILSNSSGNKGAGIFGNIGSTIETVNSTISGNSGSIYGGGIFASYNTTLEATNSTISGNSSRDIGGGIFGDLSILMNITHSTISGNSSGDKGGGIYLDEDNVLNVNGSTISGNTTASGGGIYANDGSALNLFNSTISGNHANTGGALQSYQARVTVNLLNSTITNNSAVFDGGIDAGTYGKITIGNTIIYGNTATYGHNMISPVNDLTNQGNNLVSNNFYGVFSSGTGDIVGVNPNLGALQNNGGATFTHALLTGSTAINTGNNTLANNGGLTTDQRGSGYVRIYNTTVDIGAFEVQSTVDPFLVTNNYDSGTGSLRQAILNANATAGLNTITFDSSLTGQTITLTTGELLVRDSIYINGLGANNLTIHGNNTGRVFYVGDASVSVISATLEGLTISGGSTNYSGAGIAAYDNLILTNTVISGNNAGAGGGVVGANGVTVQITNSTISGNSANAGGGVSMFNNSTVEIINSTISGNTANFGGGVAGYNNTQLVITNSTISGNTSPNSGGINAYASTTVSIINSTITANSSSGTGGVYANSNSTISMGNSILYGNTGSSVNNLNATNTTNQGNNIIGSSYSGVFSSGSGDIIGVNPNLGTLQNNGGPTFTHALLGGSSAINAGSNALASGLNYDQRGFDYYRIYDSTVDIGAFEVQTITVTNTGDSGAGSLRDAIAEANATPGEDMIIFDSSLSGQTLALTSGALNITGDLYLGGTNFTIEQSAANAPVLNINDGNNSTFTNVTIQGLTLTGSSSTANGGGIISTENLTIENSTITGNTAKNGGGIISVFGTLTIMDTNIYGNSSGRGGAIFAGRGTLNIINSTITGNNSDTRGGALNLSYNTTNIVNSTISGNTAKKGGGMFARAGSLTVINSTIYDNTAYLAGEAIFATNVATLTLGNSILYGSTGTNDLFATNIINQGNNLIGSYNSDLTGTFVNNDLVAINPMLGTLQNNGGNTLTHAIFSGSPLINSGNNTLANNANLIYDQRGLNFDRILNTTVDIGSFESNFI